VKTQSPLKISIQRLKLFEVARTTVAVAIACIFFFYPATVCFKIIFDPSLRNGGISAYTVAQFPKVSDRFRKWAVAYTSSQRAEKVDLSNCAATEWPIFGSVFYLLAAEEIQRIVLDRHDPDADKIRLAIKNASEAAIEVVVDPKTASWVKQKWGESYLSKENVFYRMLLIMGLSSYENVTADSKYRLLLKSQAESLAAELDAAPYHVLDDYPGECYPSDVLWAVAAILRSDRILGSDHSHLKDGLIKAFLARSLTKEGLPAYAVDKNTGFPTAVARGCANSGILIFASELNAEIAQQWYGKHEKYFWQENRWIRGFREFTRDHSGEWRDVDTGPIIGGYGSVASLFGIGAARTVGRMDHSVPLTMEVFALSWPSPFGLLIPSFLSYVGTGAECLGDVAVVFLMTRPIASEYFVSFDGSIPLIVWIALGFYVAGGALILVDQWFYWVKILQRKRRE